MRYLLVAIAVFVFGSSSDPAHGLDPEEIVIVVRRDDPAGVRLARYYCEQRNVPRNQIVVVDLPDVDEIPWRVYEQRIVKPIRMHMRRNRLESKIRCLLVAGRLPLKVMPDPLNEAEKSELEKLRAYRSVAELQLYQQAWRVEQLALGQMPGEPPTEVPSKRLRHYREIHGYYARAVGRAEGMLAKLPEKKRKQLAGRLADIRRDIEGLRAMDRPEPEDVVAPDYKQRRARWAADHKRIEQAEKELVELRDKHGPASMRDRRRRLSLDDFGLWAALQQVIRDQGELSGGGRPASLDSEMSLLWLENYLRDGPRNNPLRGGGIDAGSKPGSPPAALMVSRLGGPDMDRVIKVVDECMSVEKLGLGIVGKLCIDALGLAETDRHHRYDTALLAMAEWADRPEKIDLAKDASVLPLSPEEANEVGLYFGWTRDGTLPEGYRCAHGAVAVSYSNGGAEQLHQADSTRPGSRWLQAGAVGFVGMVNRGYFWGIPEPRSFADALIKEKLCLAEAYWKTCPRTSWYGVLVGDPLYRPFGPKQ